MRWPGKKVNEFPLSMKSAVWVPATASISISDFTSSKGRRARSDLRDSRQYPNHMVFVGGLQRSTAPPALDGPEVCSARHSSSYRQLSSMTPTSGLLPMALSSLRLLGANHTRSATGRHVAPCAVTDDRLLCHSMTSNNERPELPARFTVNFREGQGLFLYGIEGGPWAVKDGEKVQRLRELLEEVYEETKSMTVEL